MLDGLAAISTAISVLVAAGTWLATHLWDKRQAKIAHTANLISNFSTSDGLSEADYYVTKIVNEGKPVRSEELNERQERHIVSILNYYEYVCDMCAADLVDKRTVINLRGKLMTRTWGMCSTYVAETRSAQRRVVYAELERFVASLPAEGAFGPVWREADAGSDTPPVATPAKSRNHPSGR
ncbi:MAG: hypothetical protein WBR13_12790 [Allosphingosinicella sp.]